MALKWNFNVFTGTLDATNNILNDLSDVSVSSAQQYEHLEHDGSEWINVKDITLEAGQKLIFDG